MNSDFIMCMLARNDWPFENILPREGCYYSAADMNLPSEMLVTVIGNLLDNAFEAMNSDADFDSEKELMFGIYSRPGAVLITVDDTGSGIAESDLERIFENGYSTKGEGRGTGLYQVKAMVENFGGKITVESQMGVGQRSYFPCSGSGLP